MHRLYFTLTVLALASLLIGCAGNAVAQSQEVVPTATTEVLSKSPPTDCPVTTAKGSPSFEAPAPYSPNAPWQNIFWFGSENLWTALHADGVWSGLPLNPGGYTQKLVWWSDGYIWDKEPEPALTVTGERLDASAPLLNTSDANGVYASDMGSAMMAGFDFPTLGCWKITGKYGEAELSFVVWIAP
jgi:hypothetical protein